MHIEVVIGGTVVHHVAVVNEGETGTAGLHRYRWVAEARTPGGPTAHGVVHHRRADGAAALAARVLAALAPPPEVACTCTLRSRCVACRDGLVQGLGAFKNPNPGDPR